MNKFYLLFICLLSSVNALPHAAPNSVLEFVIADKQVICTLKLPLKELQFTVNFDVTNNTESLFENHYLEIQQYVQNHFYIKGQDAAKWQLKIVEMKLETSSESAVNDHQDLIIKIIFSPNLKGNTRNFIVFYDGIMHQLVTHKAIVYIKQDWQNGIVGHQNSEIGSISADALNGIVEPFAINLETGNNWKGFKAMFLLGMDHIAEGVDHLMFLLLLLLPSPLLVTARKWDKPQSWKSSFIKILKIVTGFTIGHSVTLFLGTLQWIETPILFVEILIALSIFITACHAIIPIFYKREILIAVAFGLIHGLAFSQTLIELELTSTKMFLSLLGFNLGIEAMQLLVIIVIMPILVYLSQNKTYHIFRIVFAIFGMIASVGWITELLTDSPNIISTGMAKIPKIGIWLYLLLLSLCLVQFIVIKKRKTKNSE